MFEQEGGVDWSCQIGQQSESMDCMDARHRHKQCYYVNTMLEFQLLVQLELRIFGGLLLQITTVNHIIMKKFLF